MFKTILFAVNLLLSGCVAKSGHQDRIQESMALTSPGAIIVSNSSSFSFAAVGDLHIGTDTSRFRRILASAQAEGDEFIVLLGDIVDKGEESSFLAVKSALNEYGFGSKVLYAIGNHDVFEDGWSYYKQYFGRSYYRVQIGNSTFIALDTADGGVGENQMEWLKTELSSVSSTNLFFLSHYLPVIPGQRTYLRLSDELEAQRLMKLAQNHQVRSWLGGHYHSYIVEAFEGVTYGVLGGGGGRRMEPVKENFFVQITVSGSAVTYSRQTVE